ncbi:VOC family protein [Aquincola sp. S2]|uniref:VOC family protein n=1 Tax=Pseudaquabacterium terrae TaxID=2732868 RepID=A0ABX2ES77_9BURK|nr:VOC family protein [Aquabacterium terrae]NRF71351.1 VOC family protein [Aquabacterium terrae]
MLRIRQAVLVARDFDAAVEALRATLPLAEPFNDPEVAQFGLRNGVMALGDTFVEVISPVQDGTAAGRHLERIGGDGGYMVMFQLDDIAAARARIRRLGLRVVYELDREGDTDIHLHPADVPGAIVALDRMDHPASWRWAGPAWVAKAPAQIGPGHVTGATLTAREPTKLASTWAAALGAEAQGDRIALDGGELRFVPGERDGISAFHLEGLAADFAFGGIRFLGV